MNQTPSLSLLSRQSSYNNQFNSNSSNINIYI